jgi:hypothetical protein
MANDCVSCRLTLEKYLCDLPSKWREQIINVICNYLSSQEFPCKDIMACLASEIGSLDPQCLADQAVWENLSFIQQMQLIIDKVCETFELGTIYLENTDAITLTGDGTALDPITATLILDTVTNGGDNIATVTGDGLYVPPNTVNLCDDLATIYVTDASQNNTISQSSYDFLTIGDLECQRISPPTGFAVSGSTRISAFGSMEWFTTLTLANTAAVSGETVILYNDATAESLTPKTGVNYFGIGPRKINDLLLNTAAYIGDISNIIVTGTITANQSDSIITTNLESKGNVSISSTVRWTGGKFNGTPDTHQVTLAGTCLVDNIRSTINVNVIVSATLINSRIEFTGVVKNALTVDASTNSTDSPTVSNIYAYSANTIAYNSLAYNPDGVITAHNITSISDGDIAAVIHGGNNDAGGGQFVTNIIGKSSVDHGIQVVSNKDLLGTVSNTNWAVSHISGFSTAACGVNCINANLKQSMGYSIASHGIQIGGSDRNSYNLNIIDCIGESKGANGLYATRDVFIIGGTYISRYDDPAGNPIYLNTVPLIPPQTLNYSIVGVKTISTDITAFAIDAAVAVTARISGCQFLNENLATAVPGVNHVAILGNITFNAVTIDPYGNIT